MSDAPATQQRAVTSCDDIEAVDLKRCSILEYTVMLFEHERAGLRFETWPDAVRPIFEKEIERFGNEYPDRTIRMVSYAAPSRSGKQRCVMVLHWEKKG